MELDPSSEARTQLERDPEFKQHSGDGGALGGQDLQVMLRLFKTYVEPMIRNVDPAPIVSDLVSKNPAVTDEYPQEQLDWVDLVLAGGGLHGIAHAGYIYALERAGVRFRSIAGTSAGSIAATLLAAARERPDQPAGTKLLEILLEMPIAAFMDGDPGVVHAVETIQATFSKQNPGLLAKAYAIWQARKLVQLQTSMGLYKGDEFVDWMETRLKQGDLGVETLADLKSKCDLKDMGISLVDQGEAEQDGAAPGAKRPMSAGLVATPHPGSPLQLEGVLVLVAADVTTCTKATLSWARPKYVSAPDTGTGAGQDGAPSPDSLKANSPLTISELYWKDPDGVNPALPVRASISLPLIFVPLHITDLPSTPLNDKSWEDVGYVGEKPSEVYLQDGGILSNFPISLFHVKPGARVCCPTFGVGLSPIRSQQTFTTLTGLLGADVMMSTTFMDQEFIWKNPDYNRIIKIVNTSPLGSLDFDPDLLDKFLLFARGVQAATEFLPNKLTADGFDWAKYKDLRQQLAKAKSMQ